MTDKPIPAQYTLFKGKSAMRLQMQKPEADFKTGCIFMQIAPFKEERNGTKIYSWEDLKISVKLGINDLTTLVYAFDSAGECSLFHKFNVGNKNSSLCITLRTALFGVISIFVCRISHGMFTCLNAYSKPCATATLRD